MADGTEAVGCKEVFDPFDQECQQRFQRFAGCPLMFIHFVFVVVVGDEIGFVAADTLDAAVGSALKATVICFGEQGIFQAG